MEHDPPPVCSENIVIYYCKYSHLDVPQTPSCIQQPSKIDIHFHTMDTPRPRRRHNRRIRKDAHPHGHDPYRWNRDDTINEEVLKKGNIIINVTCIEYYKGNWTLSGTIYGGKYSIHASGDGEYRSSLTYYPKQILRIRDLPYAYVSIRNKETNETVCSLWGSNP